MLNRKAKTTSELTYTGNRFKTSGHRKLIVEIPFESKLIKLRKGELIKIYHTECNPNPYRKQE